MSTPPQMRVRLDHSVGRYQQGRVLIGGSPMRLLRLSVRGCAHLNRWIAGHPVGDGAAAGALARRLLDAGLLHPVVHGGEATAEVAIVVPVKDNPDGVARLLAVQPADATVVLVDDGSAVPVAGAAVQHAESLGPAAARNAGARLVGTELIAFVDSDVVPEPGWLDALVPLFDDPLVGAAAPRVRATAGSGVLARYEADRCPLDLGPHPAAVRPLSRVGYLPAATLVVRAKALAEVGGFDEALRYGEDVDLVWRLLDAGWTVRYHPDALVRHTPRATVRSWLRQRFAYGTSAAPLARRHPGRLTPALLSRSAALSWALTAAGHPVAGAALAAATAVPLQRRLRSQGIPAPAALELTVRSHVSAGRMLADLLRRTWWPLVLPGRRGRLLLVSSLLPCLAEAGRRRGGLDWLRWTALRVVDDLAYSAGVWAGCARHRITEPLVPSFTARP